MTWSRDKQTALYRKNARKAFRRMLKWAKEHEDLIVTEGEVRSMGLGFEQYGDASYHLDFDALMQGMLEELADATKYAEIATSKGWVIVPGKWQR